MLNLQAELGDEQDQSVRIARLVALLSEVEAQITLETGGELDAVIIQGSQVPILLRHAQQALLLSEERMRVLLASIQDAVWSTTARSNEILYVSPAVKQIYDRTPEDFQANSNLWYETIHPDDREGVLARHAALLNAGYLEDEYRIIQPSGSIRWVLTRAWTVLNDSGEIIRIDGITRDITASRAATAEVERLRDQLHQTFEALPVSFHLLDHQWRFTYANPAALVLLQCSREELLSNIVFDLFPNGPRYDYKQLFIKAAATGIPVIFEDYYKPLDRWWEVQAYPTPQGMAVYMRDVTDEREARFHKDAILEGMAAHIALLDSDGSIIEVNRAWSNFAEAHDFTASAAGVGLNYMDIARKAGGEADKVAVALEAVIAGSLARFEQEYYCVLPETVPTWWRMVVTPAPRYRGGNGAVVVHSDITEAKRVEFALAESEERYSLAAEGANDGLFDWKLQDSRIYLSPRWKEIIGYAPSELSNDPEEWLKRLHPDDTEQVHIEIWRRCSSGHQKFESEFRMAHRDGSFRWVLCKAIVLCDDANMPLRLVGSISDVTDRKSYEDRLAHDAMHDTLTNLPNRALLIERLERAIERSHRSEGYKYAVLFIDLDDFKHVNDGLGHQVGDDLLIEVGRRLHKCVKHHDTVARLGGDEFAVLLEEISSDSAAVSVADRILEVLAVPFSTGGRDITTGASIGIMLGAPAYASPVEVLRDADTAMYRAKAAGRNQYAIFDTAMHAAALARLETEFDLRRALERDELEVHYQPIIAMRSGELKGFEALIRWRHPERGLVSPAEFIPLAEETGQIVAIGEWVALTACLCLSNWQKINITSGGDTALCMSINVSARQLTFEDLPDRLLAMAEKAGVDPANLNLELTETALLKSPAIAHKMLQKLRKYGFQIHLDDFGTGFSSLSHLHQFPIDAVKIDRSFIQDICTEEKTHELVRGILNLARGLGLDVVAEGVETPEQACALQSLGCEFAQGYWYSRPLPANEIENKWLKA